MGAVTQPQIVELQLKHFTRVSADLGKRLRAALKEGKAGAKL